MTKVKVILLLVRFLVSVLAVLICLLAVIVKAELRGWLRRGGQIRPRDSVLGMGRREIVDPELNLEADLQRERGL